MINELNGAKYFSSGIIHYYLVFIPAKNILSILVALLGLIRRSLMEFQNKILKIKVNQAVFLYQPYNHVLQDIIFNGPCLINGNIYIPKKIANVYISYTLNQWPSDLNTDFTLGSSCLDL